MSGAHRKRPVGEQTEPVMAGSTEATDDEKREGLRRAVDLDHPAGDSQAKRDDLRARHAEVGLDEAPES